MSRQIEIAKNKLHANKIKVMLEEKELKILERKEDIKRIEKEAEELKMNIETINKKITELENGL